MNLPYRQFSFILILFYTLPCNLVGSNQDVSQFAPWSLKEGWWKELTQGSLTEKSDRVQRFISSLHQAESQVPVENQEHFRLSLERISLNANQFLRLHNAKGWAIKAAPTLLEAYSIEELLNAAKQLKSSELKLLEVKSEQKNLESLYNQTLRQIDTLYASYQKTAERSLQRTLIGLDLMIAITSRAIIEERVRLAKEHLFGIEQTVEWDRSVLTAARNRLTPELLDLALIEKQINDTLIRLNTLEQDLLQLDTKIVLDATNENFDSRPLQAVLQRVMRARTQIELYIASAKLEIVSSFTENGSAKTAQQLLDEANSWLENIDKINTQIGEWKALVRREQDSVERALIRDQESNGETDHQIFIAHQKSAQQVLVNIGALEVEFFQARQLAKLVSNDAIDRLGWLSGYWTQFFYRLENLITETVEFLSYPLFRFNERPISLFKIFFAAIIFLAAYGASSVLRRLFTELVKRREHISAASLYTFNRVTHYIILLIGVVWALSSMGVDFSNLLIIAGALSVGIGFGLQGIVNNFLGGLIVLFDRKLRIGDFIELSGGETGNITEVNAQNTVIRTLTGHDILVPNSDIITRQLTNWTLRDEYARFHLPFGVAYGSDKEKVKAAVVAAARRVEQTVTDHKTHPDPMVWLVGFGDSSLNFELVVWVDFRRTKKRQSSIRAAYFWEIETALTENGIEIPFPQRDLHLKSDDRVKMEEKESK